MRLLLALDKFKDSLGAIRACEVVAETLRKESPDWQVDLCPLTDGGDGFASILSRSSGGRIEKVMVAGPRHQPTSAEIGWVQWAKVPAGTRARLTSLSMSETDRVALVEMASASGLSLLQENERDPWQADSRGTGQLLQNAAAQGAKAILLGLGGSATNDLGLGALGALGLEAMDTNGQIVEALAPAHWSRIRSLGGKISPTFPPLFLACDVTNPLLGPEGAAAIYGPQKGLRREDVERMDLASHQMAKMLTQLGGQSFSLTEAPGAGAAGGTAFGLLSFAGGRIISGGELVSDWLNLSARIKVADLVFTGEGRLDRTSLQGKGPGLVIGKALEMGKKVHVFTGAVEPGLMIPCGVEVHVISPSHVPIAEALSQAERYLQESVSLAFANGGLEKEASFSRRQKS